GWIDDHVDLIDTTRQALIASGRPWAIENVVGAPVIDPIRLCGLTSDLKVFRHRLFESNIDLNEPQHPTHKGHQIAGWRHACRHDRDILADYVSGGRTGPDQQ